MSTKPTFNFEKVNDAVKETDILDFHMSQKVQLCQDVSGLNYSQQDVVSKEQLIKYQRCIEQTIRLDYEFTMRRVDIENEMSKSILEKWHGHGFLTRND